jgi:hypothetical protein
MKKTDKILDSIWSVILVDVMIALALFSQGRTAAGVIFTVGALMITFIAAVFGRDKQKNG